MLCRRACALQPARAVRGPGGGEDPPAWIDSPSLLWSCLDSCARPDLVGPPGCLVGWALAPAACLPGGHISDDCGGDGEGGGDGEVSLKSALVRPLLGAVARRSPQPRPQGQKLK